jgi:hypothetical protein
MLIIDENNQVFLTKHHNKMKKVQNQTVEFFYSTMPETSIKNLNGFLLVKHIL